MRVSQRLIAITLLAAISTTLAACSGGNFDPTDMMDWFDTKKKIPGDRKPVFPDGVPGVEQGVPKELYKGAQQDQAPVAEAAAPPAPAPEPKAKRRSSSHTAARSAPAAPVQDAASPDTEEGGSAAVPAAPAAPKVQRKRITAPPPDAPAPQAQQEAPPPSPPPAAAPQRSTSFPAPLPSDGFTR